MNKDISCSSTVLVDAGYTTSHQTVVPSDLLLSSISNKIPQFSGNKLHLPPHICTSTYQKYTHIMSDGVSHWLFTVKAWVQSQSTSRGKKVALLQVFLQVFLFMPSQYESISALYSNFVDLPTLYDLCIIAQIKTHPKKHKADPNYFPLSVPMNRTN
jgi:hypothetical protein